VGDRIPALGFQPPIELKAYMSDDPEVGSAARTKASAVRPGEGPTVDVVEASVVSADVLDQPYRFENSQASQLL
jgi:hypothetical protein